MCTVATILAAITWPAAVVLVVIWGITNVVVAFVRTL